MSSKAKRALERANNLLANITDDNKKVTLNTLYSLHPAHFTPLANQKHLSSLFPRRGLNISLFTLNLMRLHQNKQAAKISICCMPKSGSTYLMTSLNRVQSMDLTIRYIHTPYDNPSFVNAEQRENELDELALLRAEMLAGNHVAQAHMKSSAYSDQTLRGLGYKVIVVQRNIFDCLVSMDDMICRKEVLGFAMFRPPQNYRQMDRADRLALITHSVGPWYVDFVVSWARTKLKPLFFSYEKDILGFSEATAQKIQTFLNAPHASIEEICTAFKLSSDVQKRRARINKAVAGRGADIPESARQSILDIAAPYEKEVRFFEKGLL
jgi:hypothetical protein